MDALLSNVISSLPNIAVALLMLYWQKQTIDSLLATQTKLIDQLMTYVKQDKETVQQVISANTSSSAPGSHQSQV